MAKEILKPKALAIASALTTLVLDISGFVWHGMMQQPSMMNVIYPGFWGSPSMMALGLAGSLIGAYVLGYLFAFVYNWAQKL